MSEELKATNKFNKKIIMVAAAVIVFLLAFVLTVTIPKHVEEGRLAEQLTSICPNWTMNRQ